MLGWVIRNPVEEIVANILAKDSRFFKYESVYIFSPESTRRNWALAALTSSLIASYWVSILENRSGISVESMTRNP